MTLKKLFVLCVATSLTFLAPATLQAGKIVGFSWYSGIASVAGTAVIDPVDPNNDDVNGTSPNEFFLTQKDYTGIGPVDLVFDVNDTGGVTEYLFKEGVSNSTGLDWSGYHIELGFGVGDDFNKSTSGDGLDFDAPDFNSDFDFNPSSSFFPTVDVTEDDIVASDGVFLNTMFAGYFFFHVDVPDGIEEFTIRQSPIAVPEPGALMLVSLSLLGFSFCGRRRR